MLASWPGRNSRENEALTCQIAQHPDVWFHTADCPGAHVVLRLSTLGGREAAAEHGDGCLQMAADLAAFYSDERENRKVLVSYTSPKHIRKPPKAPLGAVVIRKVGGTITANPAGSPHIPARIKALREGEGKRRQR